MDFSYDWQDFKNQLWHMLTKISDKHTWHIHGENLGWRERSGEKFIHTDDVDQFLSQILPETSEFNLCVYWEDDSPLALISCTYHDTQTAEYYTISKGVGRD